MPKDICNKSDLKDGFLRNINYLRVSITDRCNLRCFYCMPEGGISQIECDNILRYEEILRIIRISVKNGINKIRITGGEPLIRKGVVDFIKDISNIDGVEDLGLTTNGIMLESLAEELFNAGLKRINISIDSLDPKTYKKITRNDTLDKVLAGLKKAHEVGFAPIKINVVSIRGVNDSEVIEFAKLTEDYPFFVRFIEYMPIGNDNSWEKKLFISSEELIKRINEYKELLPLEVKEKSSPAVNYKLKGSKGQLGFISPISKHFCSVCNRLRLTADGKLRNCLFSENEIDLKDPLRADNSDEEISTIIRESILKKPEGHEKVTTKGDKKRSMHSIGG
ncbi:GTP 3',8-cyclase MoaA [Thermodesulfobacteriota bacterium]